MFFEKRFLILSETVGEGDDLKNFFERYNHSSNFHPNIVFILAIGKSRVADLMVAAGAPEKFYFSRYE